MIGIGERYFLAYNWDIQLYSHLNLQITEI